MTDRALDRFESLFDDEAALILSDSDILTDRLVELVETGLDVIEAILADGSEDMKIAALTKILPLATKVAEKRQDQSLAHIITEARNMMLEVFPDRTAINPALGIGDGEDDVDDEEPDPGTLDP